MKSYSKHFICLKTLIFLFILILNSSWQKNNIKIIEHPMIIFFNNNSTKFPIIHQSASLKEAQPLDQLAIVGASGKIIIIKDGESREYFRGPVNKLIPFIVSGSLGSHTVEILDKKNKVIENLTFKVDTKTDIEDGGKYGQLFNLLKKGMMVYSTDGVERINYKGKTYHYFVSWVLDNYETSIGMQYFSPYASEMIDLFKQVQRKDGMIYSFIHNDDGPGYFDTAYGKYGYVFRDGKTLFVRQPTENHVEYLYVNLIYKAWKASGNDFWMEQNLSSASRALDYCVNDSSRWSNKFQLLKRAYTIDSWDFQINDEYTTNLGIGNSMLIDPKLTKFGIFYGDNTGYSQACKQLAEMYNFKNNKLETEKYQKRGEQIMDRLNKLAWNGNFFTHHIEEDSRVHRNLGVDEKNQISQFNMYSINRGLTHEQNVAIIKSYINLKEHLPIGSPGEWYSIYPPFERGFGSHNDKWQYMNGGIAGHAIGELARGAFENGFENYAVDILNRLFDLGKKYNDKIWFAYTGSIPSPPPLPSYLPVDISSKVNMDTWDKGNKGSFKWMGVDEPGNDLRNMPTGIQNFAGIKFNLLDPDKNNRKSAISVSTKEGFPQHIQVPVNEKAACIYFLHNVSKVGSENVCSYINFEYEDGTKKNQYIINNKQLSNWWFPNLTKSDAGVAWHGSNLKSADVGIYWWAFENPYPEKKIKNISINASADGAIYTVSAITLSDKPHYIQVSPNSYGGPDNWAAATAMASLVEGLAGIKEGDKAFKKPIISPRWEAASVDSVGVTIKYAVSNGYVKYLYQKDKKNNQIKILVTGNGKSADFHLLLPDKIQNVKSIKANKRTSFSISKVENSYYVDFNLQIQNSSEIIISY